MSEYYCRSTGIRTSRLRLYPEDFLDIPVVRAPLEEQETMVAYLRAKNHQIADFIRAKQRLIELLYEQKQAIIHRAVTCGLDPDVPMKPTGLDWLPEVPEHWELIRLKNLVSNVNEQTAFRGGDEVYVALEHIESWTGKVNLPDKALEFDSQVKRFQPGDILFGKLRPYLAKVARPHYKGVCVGELLVLRCQDKSILPEYLGKTLRSRQVIGLINSSTFGAKMPRADWTFIGNVRIAFPPSHEEQRAVLDYIASETETIDAANRRTYREIELIREYRTRLISDVVTGKLDVRGVELPEPDAGEEGVDPGPNGLESVVAEGLSDPEEVPDAHLGHQ